MMTYILRILLNILILLYIYTAFHNTAMALISVHKIIFITGAKGIRYVCTLTSTCIDNAKYIFTPS